MTFASRQTTLIGNAQLLCNANRALLRINPQIIAFNIGLNINIAMLGWNASILTPDSFDIDVAILTRGLEHHCVAK